MHTRGNAAFGGEQYKRKRSEKMKDLVGEFTLNVPSLMEKLIVDL